MRSDRLKFNIWSVSANALRRGEIIIVLNDQPQPNESVPIDPASLADMLESAIETLSDMPHLDAEDRRDIGSDGSLRVAARASRRRRYVQVSVDGPTLLIVHALSEDQAWHWISVLNDIPRIGQEFMRGPRIVEACRMVDGRARATNPAKRERAALDVLTLLPE